MEKQVLKEPNSVQMIDARATKLSDYSDPITKSPNWTAVIGYPHDHTTITQQIGARRAFCYRYDYEQNVICLCLIRELMRLNSTISRDEFVFFYFLIFCSMLLS